MTILEVKNLVHGTPRRRLKIIEPRDPQPSIQKGQPDLKDQSIFFRKSVIVSHMKKALTTVISGCTEMLRRRKRSNRNDQRMRDSKED